MAKKKIEVVKRGAPIKSNDEKKRPNGLSNAQWERLQDEARSRMPPVATADILREAVDWYLTAKDTRRGDVTASEMFDDKLANPSE